MTDPTAGAALPNTITQEALATIRHDLRTLANHVLGYSEMLLEEAEDSSADDLTATLQAVHAGGKEMLAQVNTLLAPGSGDIPRERLFALAEALPGPVGQLHARVDSLLKLTSRPGLETMHADARKIHSAVVQMEVFRTTRLLSGAPPAPAHATAAAPAAPPAPPAAPAAPDVCVPGEACVLVVDDNPSNRDLLVRWLEKQGHRCIQAGDGRQALDALRCGRFDLVLLDILMPGMDGHAVLDHLKADPALRDLPVIMISALDDIESVVRCIEGGAEDYLPKPFDPVLLRARVGACLEKKRLRDQELEYLAQVAAVTAAASALEAGEFRPDSLDTVARRVDALGRLARVFQRMGLEVQAREQRLRQQVQQLRIEIDEARRTRQVEEITGSDYFQVLRRRAGEIRSRVGKSDG